MLDVMVVMESKSKFLNWILNPNPYFFIKLNWIFTKFKIKYLDWILNSNPHFL